MKTLLALVERPGHVCWRYRTAPFAGALAERGWRLETVALARGVVASWRQLGSVASADAVLLQRRLVSWWQIRRLRRYAKRLVFDIDDAVFLRDSNSTRGHESRRRAARFRAIVSRADATLAGNAFLLAEAARWGPAHRFPTCVDPSLYPLPGPRAESPGLRLVWIGSQSTMPSLDAMRPGLAEAAKRIPGLSLRVICDAFPTLPGVPIEPVTWSEATEARELAEADVGVSWLPEHPWSLGKCGLKVLQYMAAGLPVIANPYGVHCGMIVPGETGALAQTPAEWADALVRWAQDATERRRLGAAGRRRVEAEYSVQAWATRWADVVTGASAYSSSAIGVP